MWSWRVPLNGLERAWETFGGKGLGDIENAKIYAGTLIVLKTRYCIVHYTFTASIVVTFSVRLHLLTRGLFDLVTTVYWVHCMDCMPNVLPIKLLK